MNLESAQRQAIGGNLYPSCILHGSDPSGRRDAVLGLARALLCEREPRPCGECKHCRRIAWPGESDSFHPDFQVLERDLRTSTSVEAARTFLRAAQMTPFEARGQVFVVADADSLTPEAANAFLKSLEEPHTGSPRHFFLLAPSQFDLLPTLRSRSLSVYLGSGLTPEEEGVARLVDALADALEAFDRSGSRLQLFAIAGALQEAGGWQDPRARRPWEMAAAALVELTRRADVDADRRRRLLALAEEMQTGPDMRVRGIQPQRILEGLVSAHLEG